jgi:hypothetical protein
MVERVLFDQGGRLPPGADGRQETFQLTIAGARRGGRGLPAVRDVDCFSVGMPQNLDQRIDRARRAGLSPHGWNSQLRVLRAGGYLIGPRLAIVPQLLFATPEPALYPGTRRAMPMCSTVLFELHPDRPPSSGSQSVPDAVAQARVGLVSSTVKQVAAAAEVGQLIRTARVGTFDPDPAGAFVLHRVLPEEAGLPARRRLVIDAHGCEISAAHDPARKQLVELPADGTSVGFVGPSGHISYVDSAASAVTLDHCYASMRRQADLMHVRCGAAQAARRLAKRGLADLTGTSRPGWVADLRLTKLQVVAAPVTRQPFHHAVFDHPAYVHRADHLNAHMARKAAAHPEYDFLTVKHGCTGSLSEALALVADLGVHDSVFVRSCRVFWNDKRERYYEDRHNRPAGSAGEHSFRL